MKLDSVKSYQQNFEGKRLFRKTISQLAKNNKYSLTEVNQRNIRDAITELGKVDGSKNVNFLLNTAKNLKYSTNIVLEDAPKNNWKALLLSAAAAASAITVTPNSYSKKIEEISQSTELSKDEVEILNLRQALLDSADLEQIQRENLIVEKNFKKNLDYFVVSSETTINDKKYVLEKLKYFMSDEYKINPQLKDKKSVVLAEIVNDIAINTPGNKYPNIKAVNQKQHGMCAAISIVRKKLVYEDKPNYIDSLLSELDDTSFIKVYDRSQLGTGKKTIVEKVPVDFATAIKEGYRIIDASTMHWMQIAHMGGSSNLSYDVYTPFDTENFDVRRDSFYNVKFQDENLSKVQNYYQSLLKAKELIQNYKARKIKITENITDIHKNVRKHTELMGEILGALKEELMKDGKLDYQEVNKLLSGILNLEKKYSANIKNNKYEYIHNEEDIMIKDKIRNYILDNSSLTDVNIDKIYDLITYYKSVITKPVKDKKFSIRQVRNLYEIGAAFRNQVVAGLEVEQVLDASMRVEKLGTKEGLIIKAIDDVIEKLEKNSPHTAMIMEQLDELNDHEKTKEGMLESLKELRESVEVFLTQVFDKIYASLVLGDRHQNMKQFIENLLEQVKENNKDVTNHILKTYYKTTPKNLVKLMEKDIAALDAKDEKAYNEIIEKFGINSQTEYMKKLYQSVLEQMGEGISEEYLNAFAIANGIDVTKSTDEVAQAISQAMEIIKTQIDFVESSINACTQRLDVIEPDGTILVSADPKNVIIKLYENKDKIPKKSNLKKLQLHLERVVKDKSSDEFNSRQGKLRDKSLYIFTNQEKETINRIEKSINPMNAFVQKEINSVEKNIKPQLEELKRIIGLNNGHWWVREEGTSGLYDEEQIRILEFMTGKPHYVLKDKKLAIEKLKNSPKSGMTSSSVYHTDHGWHTQYIADIRPIEIKVKNPDGTVTVEKKDVLLHDNTWGVAENENVWTDSNGIRRTDYSDDRGGSLGYITNDELQNGNFVDRILNKMFIKLQPDKTRNHIYKKIKNIKDNDTSEIIQQYGSILLEGDGPKTKSVADSIHDTVFISDTRHLKKLEKLLKDKTEEEVSSQIYAINNVGNFWKTTYEKIKSRIFSNFSTRIATEADYNKLADDDYLKVLMEKIALKNAYQIVGLEPKISKVTRVSDLNRYKAAQKIRALNDFKYSFGKDSMVVKYIAERWSDKDDENLEAILKKHNIELPEEDFLSIDDDFGFQTEGVDGSLKTFIDLLMEDVSLKIDKVITNPEANNEFKDYHRKFFEKNLYFTEKDINNPKIQHLINFIDREFDPIDDAELVEIYNRIQNMTLEEFQKEILPKVKPEDLGMKNTSGFEVLQRIQNYDEKMNKDLINTIYADYVVPLRDSDKYKVLYKQEKFTRKATYDITYNFDTIYNDIKGSIEYLTLPKLFNKYKDRNIRKYNAYPAYPKLDYMPESVAKNSFDYVIKNINETVEFIKESKALIRSYEIKEELIKYGKSYPTNKVLTTEEMIAVRSLLEEFYLINQNDDSIKNSVDSAFAVLNLPEDANWSEYLPYIKNIVVEIATLEKTSPTSVVQNAVSERIFKNDIIISGNMQSLIRERYQSKMRESFQKYKQILIKEGNEAAEKYKETLFEEFLNSHLLNNPVEILDLYIKSNTKDSKISSSKSVYKMLLERCINYAKLSELEEVLMDATNDGIEMNAKKLFKNYRITLSDEDISMDSDRSIAYMIHQLLLDDSQDTALLFIDKLGLGEQYIKYMSEVFDYETMESSVDEACKLATDFNDFQSIVLEEFRKTLAEYENGKSNNKKIIDKFIQTVRKTANDKDLDRKIIKNLITNLVALRDDENESDVAKMLLLKQIYSSGLSDASEIVNEMLEQANNGIRSNGTIMNMINNIILKENSKANKIREDMNSKFGKIYDKCLNNQNLQEQ